MESTVQKRSLKGAFITFEGIDGCGKTTQARLLAEKLRERGVTVLDTREPGGTRIGTRLREILIDPEHTAMAPMCELMLYLADRIQHLREVIRPAMARGHTVICDRYHDATVAYQKYGRGLDFSVVDSLIAREIGLTPPTHTFWLDTSLETARARIDSRNRTEGSPDAEGESRLEREESAFHRRVEEGYRILHREQPGRILRIDGEQEPGRIESDIREMLEERYVL